MHVDLQVNPIATSATAPCFVAAKISRYTRIVFAGHRSRFSVVCESQPLRHSHHAPQLLIID